MSAESDLAMAARVARLEQAIRNHLELCTEETWDSMKSALSDAGEPSCVTMSDNDLTTALAERYDEGAADMREQAVHLSRRMIQEGFGSKIPEVLARLPLEGTDKPFVSLDFDKSRREASTPAALVADMRERAAKYIEDRLSAIADNGVRAILSATAKGIRAMPLEGKADD